MFKMQKPPTFTRRISNYLFSDVTQTYTYVVYLYRKLYMHRAGKSFLEVLIFASTNPQYDKRLFIELQLRYMKIASSEHFVYINCFKCQNKNKKIIYVQVNLCQKYLFTCQLTHNMTTDCSMNYEFSTRKLQAQYMLCTSNCFLFLLLH